MAKASENVGGVYRGPRGRGWVVDVRPVGLIYTWNGVPLTDRAVADRLLEQIRTRIVQGMTLEEAALPFLSAKNPSRRVVAQYGRWVDFQNLRADAGDLSPRTVAEYRRYARDDGEVDWWEGRTVFDITTGALEDWGLWMAGRGLGPKTRRNILGAFKTFVRWMKRREVLRDVPLFPVVAVPEYVPQIISAAMQRQVLETMADPVEWLSHAIPVHCALRPGELRALAVSDYLGTRDGVSRLRVSHAMQSGSWQGEPTHTKNRRAADLPISDDLAAAIERLWPAAKRLATDPESPLVWNPRTGRRWTHWALRESWLRGCKAAKLPPVPLYEGTKHSAATDMLAKTGDLEAVQRYLRHRGRRSTEHYAKVLDSALVDIAKRGNKK
jgi:integrase